MGRMDTAISAINREENSESENCSVVDPIIREKGELSKPLIAADTPPGRCGTSVVYPADTLGAGMAASQAVCGKEVRLPNTDTWSGPTENKDESMP